MCVYLCISYLFLFLYSTPSLPPSPLCVCYVCSCLLMCVYLCISYLFLFLYSTPSLPPSPLSESQVDTLGREQVRSFDCDEDGNVNGQPHRTLEQDINESIGRKVKVLWLLMGRHLERDIIRVHDVNLKIPECEIYTMNLVQYDNPGHIQHNITGGTSLIMVQLFEHNLIFTRLAFSIEEKFDVVQFDHFNTGMNVYMEEIFKIGIPRVLLNLLKILENKGMVLMAHTQFLIKSVFDPKNTRMLPDSEEIQRNYEVKLCSGMDTALFKVAAFPSVKKKLNETGEIRNRKKSNELEIMNRPNFYHGNHTSSLLTLKLSLFLYLYQYF
jgi:hypothetical protein